VTKNDRRLRSPKSKSGLKFAKATVTLAEFSCRRTRQGPGAQAEEERAERLTDATG
jgi:hypothetical protein